VLSAVVRIAFRYSARVRQYSTWRERLEARRVGGPSIVFQRAASGSDPVRLDRSHSSSQTRIPGHEAAHSFGRRAFLPVEGLFDTKSLFRRAFHVRLLPHHRQDATVS